MAQDIGQRAFEVGIRNAEVGIIGSGKAEGGKKEGSKLRR